MAPRAPRRSVDAAVPVDIAGPSKLKATPAGLNLELKPKLAPKPKQHIDKDEILVPESPPQLRVPLSQLEYRFQTRYPEPRRSNRAQAPNLGESKARSPTKLIGSSSPLETIFDEPVPVPVPAGASRTNHHREGRGRDRAKVRDRLRDLEERRREIDARSRSPTRCRHRTDDTIGRYPECHRDVRERERTAAARQNEGASHHQDRYRDRHRIERPGRDHKSKTKPRATSPLHPLTENYTARRAHSDGHPHTPCPRLSAVIVYTRKPKLDLDLDL